MGRVIVPELLAVLVLLVLCGLTLIVIGVAQQGIVRGIIRQRTDKRAQAARQAARWESRLRYQRGYAVIDVVRIARWGKQKEVVEIESREPETFPEDDVEKMTKALLAADLRAEQRNRRLT